MSGDSVLLSASSAIDHPRCLPTVVVSGVSYGGDRCRADIEGITKQPCRQEEIEGRLSQEAMHLDTIVCIKN